MDKNFITENKFTDAVERFKQLTEYKSPKQSLKKLYEYTFITAPQVNEDGDENNDGNMEQPNPNDDANSGQMGMDNSQQMPQNAAQMPQNDMPQPMPQDNAAQGGDDMGDLDVPNVDDDGIETEEMEDGDEVIDVDELTQSQEATEYKIDGVDDRLAQIYAIVQKFSNQLDKNEQSIMALKDEFEKRNPTEEERLNLRSQSSYPYSETPKDYWDNQTKKNPHYNVMYDNEVSPSEEQQKFEIRRSDIDGLNMKSISDSLKINQDLNKYLGF